MDKKRESKVAMAISTRPQDWIPATRIHLFGRESLSAAEWEIERTRMSGGRRKYRSEQ